METLYTRWFIAGLAIINTLLILASFVYFEWTLQQHEIVIDNQGKVLGEVVTFLQKAIATAQGTTTTQ